MQDVLKGFKYQIYPNDEQKIFFTKNFGCKRFIYNQMLNDKIEYYKENKKQLHNTPAQYKDKFPFLKEVDSLSLSNAQIDLEQAFTNFFKNPKSFGFPNFKSKKYSKMSYTTNNQSSSIRIVDNKIKLPKIGFVKFNYHQPIKGIIKSATISKTKSGKYFISILCQVDEIKDLPKTNKQIGIDLGLKEFAILSNGEKIENPKFLDKSLKKLKREQRKLSKKQNIAKNKGLKLQDCKNYQKQRLVVAKLHEKVSNQRKDFLHQLSISLVKNYDIIAIEDLNIKGMLKNHKLAKSISDVSWSKFVTFLSYKSKWYGKQLIAIDRFYPSSKLCNKCGYKNDHLELKDRVWICPECNTEHDRDINAAINILNEGLRLIV